MRLDEIIAKKNQKSDSLNEMYKAIEFLESTSIEVPNAFRQLVLSCQEEIERLDRKENQLLLSENIRHVKEAFKDTCDKLKEVSLPAGLHVFNLTFTWDENKGNFVISDFEVDQSAKVKIKKLIYLLQERVDCVKEKSEEGFQLYLINNALVNVRSQGVKKDIGTEKFLFSINMDVLDEQNLKYILYITGISNRFVLFPKEFIKEIVDSSSDKLYRSNQNANELLFDIDVANCGLKVRNGELIPFPSKFIYDLEKNPDNFPSFQ